MDDHPEALFAAGHHGIGYGPARISELPEVSGERQWVLGEDGEDGADDVTGKTLWQAQRAQRNEGRGDVLQGVFQQGPEAHAHGAQAFPCLKNRSQSPER